MFGQSEKNKKQKNKKNKRKNKKKTKRNKTKQKKLNIPLNKNNSQCTALAIKTYIFFSLLVLFCIV